jgi:hypothetical protein
VSEDQPRATNEAKQHVKARPATAPSHEAGIARYLGAQHYRERKAHQETATALVELDVQEDERHT